MADTTVDYSRHDPDPSLEPKEYGYVDRRAEILKLVIEAGGPHNVNKSQLAERYDVHRQTIYDDLDALAEYIDDRLGDDILLRTQAIFEKVVRELMNEGEWRQAWLTAKEWNQWAFERGVIDKQAEPIRADVTHRDASTESEEYAILDEEEFADIDADEVEALTHPEALDEPDEE